MEGWSSGAQIAIQSGLELGWEKNFSFPLVHQLSEAAIWKRRYDLNEVLLFIWGPSQRRVNWELFIARGWFHPGRGIWWHRCHLLSLLCFLPPADMTGHSSFWKALPLASEFSHSFVFSFFLLLCWSSFFTRIPQRCPWTFSSHSAEANAFSCL